MRTVLLTLAAALFASGCASHENTKIGAAEALSATSNYRAANDAEQAASKSYGWGDRYTAANLYQKAEEADPTIMNRFNLATAYAAIGRNDAASGIFESLVVDGQYKELNEEAKRGPAIVTGRFNVGEEAQRRLDILDSLPPGPTGAIGGQGTGHSDAEAKQLDQRAEDARGMSYSALPQPPRL